MKKFSNMDLTGLRWTKSIAPQGEEPWGYLPLPMPPHGHSLISFPLAWKNTNGKDEKNARQPKKDDLIILRQKGKVTHIIQMANENLYYKENPRNDEWNIYRLVQLVWTKKDCKDFPPNQQIFGDIKLPQGGKVISLEKIQGFREYWNNNNRGGLQGFQNHVREFLNIDTGWVQSSTLVL